MPKKPAKGAFWYFMLEYKNKEERRGRKFEGGIQQALKECAPHWETMNEAQRARFKEIAKNQKGNTQSQGEKLTSQGVPFTHIEKEKKARQEVEKKKRLTVEQTIDHATLTGSIKNREFVLIHFNYFCKTMDDIYSPAEVSLLKFNLELGIIDTYHTLVNPGSLPTGMAYEAKLHSENWHKLTPPPNALGEILFSNVFREIHEFAFDYDKNQVHTLYTSPDHIPIAESILNTFAVEADESMDTFSICSITELFFHLKSSTAKLGEKMNIFPSIHIAQAMLDKDSYQYFEGLACEIHEEMDNIHCSLSIVKRWAYTITDHCAIDLGINLIAGKHVPIGAKVPTVKLEDNSDDENDSHFKPKFEDDNVSHVSSKYSYSEYSDFTNLKNHRSGITTPSAVTIKTEPGSSNTSMNYWKRNIPIDNEKKELDFYSLLKNK